MLSCAKKLFLGLCLCYNFSAFGAIANGELMFTAWLTGLEEVPPVTTDARGLASVRLTENHDSLIIMALATGLSGEISGASILESRRGTTGGAIKSLELMQAGNKFYGVLTGAELSSTLIAKMMNGETYINIYTAENPNGEIRGQIGLEKDPSFHAILNGENVVPAVNTSAYGIAAFNLSRDNSLLHIRAVFQGISNITGIKLAMAKPGENGGNVMELLPFLQNNIIDTVIAAGQFGFLAADSLKDDKIYIQVSSGNNPNGEIRGHLYRQYGLNFIADLNGNEEIPAVNTNARGLGIFTVNNTFDTLIYNITFNGLSSDITSAALYLGKRGETGGMILDLSDSVSGNLISGKAYGILLTKAMVKALIKGEVYINIKTKNNTNGEIRSQLVSTLRTTYAFEFCSQQEVPKLQNGAQGLGVVSIDKDSTNLRYLIVTDSLSSEITGLHFYRGSEGVEGTEILAINTEHNSAEGYWKNTSATPFTKELSQEIADEKIYLNIKTANNPTGEIRGQIVNRALCTQLLSIKKYKLPDAEISVFPMPFSTDFTVAINAIKSAKYKVNIYDMNGREIYTNITYIHTGKNALNIPLQESKGGLFMMKISLDGKNIYTKKILKIQ